jgi:hypothetical protein
MHWWGRAAVLAVVGMGAVLSGCAVTRVAPPEVSGEARREKAVVYFYRPSSVLGVARTIDVFHRGIRIGRLTSGTHFLYVFDPGKHDVTAEMISTTTILIDAHPGQTYYVRASVDVGFPDAKPDIAVVLEGRGREEITKTKYVVPD